ncbi:MAG: alpha/beta hydrolase family protein [Gordonia sp. (in: high G+C Gram-positive bacteria)]|uniref:alpha/beta hydrolase n=1 Tax=Gordonia sp. (in: high G+C Gram-positive bacteria) TaxID=84139 RepID=UPI0039E6AF5C
MQRRTRFSLTTLLLAIAATVAAPLAAPSAPAQAAVVGVRELNARTTLLSVYSPAMHRVVRSHVLHPPGKPGGLPSFYLMGGAGGAEDGISWYNFGGVKKFFANKRVNVVLPIGGRFSMMTDWQNNDPMLGRNKWQTFFTRELPDAVNQAFGTNGSAALGGVSMSAGPALDLVEHAPSRFRAVAAYSGCPGTTDALGLTANIAIPIRGGGNPGNMWGAPVGPKWYQHDPVINAGKLRGKTIWLSAGSGLPGPIDGGPLEVAGGLFGGNVMEAWSLACTNNMSNRLNQLGIPHTMHRRPDGAHTWGLFAADMRASWPKIARAIGA